ncbi:hypothetical protein [Persephonella sp.]
MEKNGINYRDISFLTKIMVLYFSIIFTLPYFLHYGFIPNDIVFFDAKFVYLIVLVGAILYILNLSVIFSFIVHIISFCDVDFPKKLKWAITISTFILFFISIKFPVAIFVYTLFVLLQLDVIFLGKFKYDILIKMYLYNGNNFKLIKRLMRTLSIIIILIPTIVLVFININKDILTFLSAFTISTICFYLIALFTLLHRKELFLGTLLIFLLAPVFFWEFNTNSYLNILKLGYEKLSLTKGNAEFYVNEDMCKFLAKESERRKEKICEDIKKIWFEGKFYYLIKAEIIWNGSKFIYISTKKFFNGDRQRIIPIPKQALLNGDIITEFRESN